MKVTLSMECQESTPLEAEKEVVTEALRLYPQIDVIELITPEGLRRLRLWENRFRCSVEHLKAISELEQIARFAMKEYCNPLDIPYKFQHYRGFAHREAADPTMVYFRGRYYLFASMCKGFYHSADMVHWEWHEGGVPEPYGYAPDVRQRGEFLYFCASGGDPSRIWRTKDPLSGEYELVSEPFAFWDPDIFFDEDGKAYLFWGSSDKTPLYGVELDAETMMPVGETAVVYSQDISSHGWERNNKWENFDDKYKMFPNTPESYAKTEWKTSYLEGAYLTKWNGKYYLQFAAPGTELSCYGDGCCTADHPLGPYRFQPNTPFSLKPSGFITGAGHGSTIADEYGNLWHASTMCINVHAPFERRLGLFPAGVDEDGLLYCNQNFADYPIVLPEGKFDPRELAPHYMLLSYRKKAAASSSREGHAPELALNEDIRSWWSAEGGAGEWYRLDLGKIYAPHSVQLNFAEEEIPRIASHPDLEKYGRYIDDGKKLRTRYRIDCSNDGETWELLVDASFTEEDRSHPYHILPAGTRFRYLRVTAAELPYGSRFALSGLRVFGLDDGEKPKAVPECRVKELDPMTAVLNWEPAEGAVGYNVRYGIAPEKLYTSYLLYEKSELLLTGLNAGQEYFVCVDSFNESGVTEGAVQKLR